ncbi:MAG TPA: hypothetical protein VKC51_12285 [Lacunisphaera sp.]|nr:hypothetical protein [Lacunisphaera sp.]
MKKQPAIRKKSPALTPSQRKYPKVRTALGEPLQEELPTADGLGRYRDFQRLDGCRGSIHWHPMVGAFETHGEIRNRWAKLGFEKSFLGYPVSDETDLISQGEKIGRFSKFQHGQICWVDRIQKTIVYKEEVDGTSSIIDDGFKIPDWIKNIDPGGRDECGRISFKRD